MGSNFGSFDQSPLGAFIQSPLGARGQQGPTGNLYAAGTSGAWLYDADQDKFVQPWDTTATGTAIAVHSGIVVMSAGTGIKKLSGTSWVAVGSTSVVFSVLRSFNGSLYGISTVGTIYLIDLDAETYTLKGTPGTSTNVKNCGQDATGMIFSPFVSGWGAYEGVSSTSGIRYDGSTFSTTGVSGGGGVFNASFGVFSAGGIIHTQRSYTGSLAVPDQFGPASWNGSWSQYQAHTFINDSRHSMRYFGGYLNSIYYGAYQLGKKGEVAIYQDDSGWGYDEIENFSTDINRVAQDESFIYFGLSGNDATYGGTVISFDGAVFAKKGTVTPSVVNDVFIG